MRKIKVAVCELGYICSDSSANKQKQIEGSNWLYFTKRKAFYEITTNKTTKTMKGNIENKQKQSISLFLGSNV